MSKPRSKSRSKKPPKRVLALPDLEQAKAAVLNSLTSASGQRTYDHAIAEFVAWYCSEPRLAFMDEIDPVRWRRESGQSGGGHGFAAGSVHDEARGSALGASFKGDL